MNSQNISQFKQNAKDYGYKGRPIRSGKITAAYKKYMQQHPDAPLPAGKVYNSKTKRIIDLSQVITPVRGQVKKQFRNEFKKVEGQIINKVQQQNISKKKISKLTKTPKMMKIKYKASLRKQIKDMPAWAVDQEGIDIDLDMINDDITNLLDMLEDGERYLIQFGNNFYTLNENNIKDIAALVPIWTQETTGDSKNEIISNIKNYDIAVLKKKKPLSTTVPESGFFPMYNNTDIDLSKYGIHKEFDKENYQFNCLYNALKAASCPVKKLCKLETMLYGRDVRHRKFGKMAEILNITINVKSQRGNDKARTVCYNKGCDEVYYFAVHRDHIFINDKVPFTSYFIKNYNELKDDDKNMRKTGPKNYKATYLDAFDAVRLMDDLGMFTPMPDKDKYQTVYSDTVKNKYDEDGMPLLKDLTFTNSIYDEKDNPEGDLKKIAAKKTIVRKFKYVKMFFDFETSPYDVHKPYCCCYVMNNNDYAYKFWGWDCAKQMLNHMNDNIKQLNKYTDVRPHLIAHNLTYDWTFLSQAEGVSSIQPPIEKNGKTMQAEFNFYKTPFKATCSLQRMGMSIPLKKFKKCFGVDVEKDIMPYGVCTVDNINKRYIPLNACLNHLRQSEHEDFKINCDKLKCIDKNGLVDMRKYALHYCEKDCIVLSQGYEKYRQMILDVDPKIDCDNYITLASMAHDLMIHKGAYEGCQSIGNVPRDFIQKCVVGGRCMMANNKPAMYCDDGLQGGVIDACSLYPAAIKELCEAGCGFLKGAPKIIQPDMTAEELKHVNAWFALVKITKVGKNRAFPILSYIHPETGVRTFSNNMVGRYVYVDNITMEDAVKFQGIEYEIIQGYYYDNDGNKKGSKVMQELYNTRNKMKAEHNPIQIVYKLFLNSIYGKNLLKPTFTTTKYKKPNDWEDYVSRNFNNIKMATITHNGKQVRIEEYSEISTHFTSPHIGVQILSMSKRIMNRVMYLAEDNGITISYQDTDSCHIPDGNDMNKLFELYRNEYNFELNNAAKLGCVHPDLESGLLESHAKKLGLKDDEWEIITENQIFLGKKNYCEDMKGKNLKTGEFFKSNDGKDIVDYAAHLKGIPTGSIHHRCHKLDKTPIELFKMIYNGKAISFNLLREYDVIKKECWARPSFILNKDFTITSRMEFPRIVKVSKEELI